MMLVRSFLQYTLRDWEPAVPHVAEQADQVPVCQTKFEGIGQGVSAHACVVGSFGETPEQKLSSATLDCAAPPPTLKSRKHITGRVCIPLAPHEGLHGPQLPMLHAYDIWTVGAGIGVGTGVAGVMGAAVGVTQLLHDPGHERRIVWSVKHRFGLAVVQVGHMVF